VTLPDPRFKDGKRAGSERARERRKREKVREGIGEGGGSRRRMGVAHPSFAA